MFARTCLDIQAEFGSKTATFWGHLLAWQGLCGVSSSERSSASGCGLSELDRNRYAKATYLNPFFG
jgi:hypothetical protein